LERGATFFFWQAGNAAAAGISMIAATILGSINVKPA